MDPMTITYIWLISGVVMMLSEIGVPGFIIGFVGLAAVLVGGLRWIGWLSHLGLSFLLCGVFSVLMIVALRKVAVRLVPSESHRENIDEDIDALDQEVEVVEVCNDHEATGRIRYQGTTWAAMTLEGEIPAGTKARLLYRDNLAWIIEPLNTADAFSVPITSQAETHQEVPVEVEAEAYSSRS